MMRLATICLLNAVSFTGCTAGLEESISTALLPQIGPPSAAPIAHIYANNAATPTMLTSQLVYDAEPPASGVANIKCAADLQPLGSGLHSISSPVYSLFEGDQHLLAYVTMRQTLTPGLQSGAELELHGVRELMLDVNGRDDMLLRSGCKCPRSVLSSAISTRIHDGSGTFTIMQRLWSARRHAKATGGRNGFVGCVSILRDCTCISAPQLILVVRKSFGCNITCHDGSNALPPVQCQRHDDVSGPRTDDRLCALVGVPLHVL